MKTNLANRPLAELLDRHTVIGAPELCRIEHDRIRCLACGHRCAIAAGQRGICKVRFNDAGQLRVPFGYVAGLQCDPVEKKPFFHVHPGSDALTFGMMGCDLHCAYCQNWITSQALRDSAAVAPVREITPQQLIAVATRERARLVVSSYNEPLITAEWAVAVFEQARKAGLPCAFVSNGNATAEVLDFLRPWIVAYKVDLKSFSDRNYRKLGGVLDNITTTIRMVHERGIWLEVVTLIVPGFNDDPHELREIARFLASVSRDIPWHVTAFHQDYRMTDPDPTSAETLMRAAEMGAAEGLRYVYAGNLPGRVGEWENTRCPSCGTTVLQRHGYLVRSYRITSEGCCPDCRATIPGIWPHSPSDVKAGNDQAAYQSRMPRRVAAPMAEDVSYLQDRRQGLPLITEPRGEPTPMAATQPSAAAAKVLPGTRPVLAAAQKTRLLAAVSLLLRNVVTGQPAVFPQDAADLANLPVAGAFISLKRGPHLRACCGMLGPLVTVQQALTHAAERTIWEDERFPPVSPTELSHLTMEVWLLFNPRPVEARGPDRAAAITIGTHGIQVVRGQSRGLFLPGVATEHQWDAATFLDRVCLKAGLPAAAWREEETALATFEGEMLQSPLRDLQDVVAATGPCRAEDLAKLAALCRANLVDLLRGAAPPYFVGAPDGMLNGVILFVQRPGTQELRTFSRISLRPAVAMQATLFGLVQSAAKQLSSQGVAFEKLAETPVGLALLHDPVLHGNVADARLEGFDPKRRALLVLERNKSGLVFDARQSAEALLKEAASQARVHHPEGAMVFSLAIVTNMVQVAVSTAPTPVRGPALRPPAVAGKFYDGDPAALARAVDALLEGPRQPRPWAAAMVPHAGLKFSGRIAAEVLKRIQIPKTVIVIGPSHTGRGMEWAVAPQQTWALPGLEVASDFMLARQLCQAIAGLEMDAVAHQHEHAIEVELPLLARLAPESKVVGITIGHGDLESCRRFARGLAEVMQGRKEPPLLLISSDMNHFAGDAENRRLDALALDALERLDPEKLLSTVQRHHISMCGVLPAVIVLETLRLMGQLSKAERVAYATTADVTGDKSRVVGYAGMLFG